MIGLTGLDDRHRPDSLIDFTGIRINAQHVKNVSGRKSDNLDCQWLQQLHAYGLLPASFRSPEEILALRTLVHHREMLVKYRASHIQHMQKALQLMNLQLTKVGNPFGHLIVA